MLDDAESALGRLDGVSQLLPNPNVLVPPYLVREAVASTRIEDYRHRVTQPNALALIDVVFDRPVLTSRLVERHVRVTRPTSLRLLQLLAPADILTARPTGPADNTAGRPTTSSGPSPANRDPV